MEKISITKKELIEAIGEQGYINMVPGAILSFSEYERGWLNEETFAETIVNVSIYATEEEMKEQDLSPEKWEDEIVYLVVQVDDLQFYQKANKVELEVVSAEGTVQIYLVERRIEIEYEWDILLRP